ncbi:MAG: uncharacterized protein HW413_2727 [Thermoleophilia bacterium]|nr:uncharacterized protein [Thermoleophilia bacterium]
MTARTIIQSITPPFLVDAARWVRAKVTGSPKDLPVWEHVAEGWSRRESDPNVRGWDVDSIRHWHSERFPTWSRAFEAPNPLGASEYAREPTEQHLHSHNVHVSFAYVLTFTSGGRKSLSILDWGGGIGQYYLLARATLPGVALSYHCKDLPLLCQTGRELLPEVTFSEDERCLEQRYDLVLASNSLQYSEDWVDLLGKLAASAREYVYVAQLPTVLETPSFVAVQRPYAHGYDTEYLGWILNRESFLGAAATSGLRLAREFFFDNPVAVHGIAEPAVHRGFLLRPVAASNGAR